MADADRLETDSTGPLRRRRRWWRPGVLVAIAVLSWLLAAGAVAAVGAEAARTGAERVRALDMAVGVRELLDGEGPGEIEAVLQDFQRADRLLHNPLLVPLRHLPVVGRQLRSAGALSATAADVLAAADGALQALQAELDDGAPTGAGRVAAIGRLHKELLRIRATLGAADLGPSEALVGPLREARREVADRVTEATRRTEDLIATVRVVEELVTGPTDLLVLAANNAEMRVGSGMVLSVGAVRVVEGELEVSRPFTPAPELVLPEPVPVPDHVRRLWRWSAIGWDFRSLGLTARFPVNAPIAADHWAALGNGAVDDVLLVDVVALRALLRVTGPVTIDGLSIDHRNVLDHLLEEQYEGADDDPVNEVRRERLSELATVVLEALGGSDIDLGALVDGLREARDGRHLMLWSRDDRRQQIWEDVAIDGELDPGALLVGLANIDGSKLDPFLSVRADVDADEDGDVATYEVDIEIRNATSDGLPTYVIGTDDSPSYRGLVSAHLPGAASDVSLDGFGELAVAGQDGPTTVVAAVVTVPQGESRRGTLRFSLPVGVVTDVRVHPSARVPAVRWLIDGRERTDRSRFALAPDR